MKPVLTCSVIAVAILLSLSAALCQKPLAVMDWKTEYTVNTHLLQLMHRQYDARRTALASALQTRKSTRAYVTRCRSKFLRLLGNLPPHSPLNASVVGVVAENGYRIEKVIYESFERHHVTANLYVPDGQGPFPAALLFCGHEDVAKATESYQQTAILFAKHGFIIFVLDPISQCERYQLTDPGGTPLTRGGTTEHTLLNASSNLLGTSTAAYELWDNERGLDYLVTRHEVDTSRIGCLGNSGGGIQTIYFSAYEPRMKVAAVCSYLANRERTLDLSGPADGCAQIPDEGKFEMEMSDYLIAAAPNPILVLAGRYDFIDYTGTESAFADLKKVYSALGHSQKASLFTYDDGHGFTSPKREAAVAWFRKWLCNDSSPVVERPAHILTSGDLSCTATGQLNAFYKNELTVAQRNLDLFDAFAAQRKTFLRKGKSEILDTLRSLLSIEKREPGVEVERVGEVVRSGVTWQKMVLRTRGEIPLPILIAYPEVSLERVVVCLHDQGKAKLADSTTLVQQYLRRGCAVVLCDIRGTGETTDKPELNDPKYYNNEYRNAMLSLHIGRTLVGQRVVDILTVFDFLIGTPSLAQLPVDVDAWGMTALPALHAAVLSDKPTAVTLHGALRSFRTMFLHPADKNWYSYVIPRAASYYDIQDLPALDPRLHVEFED